VSCVTHEIAAAITASATSAVPNCKPLVHASVAQPIRCAANPVEPRLKKERVPSSLQKEAGDGCDKDGQIVLPDSRLIVCHIVLQFPIIVLLQG
jgi:hypothetical protein